MHGNKNKFISHTAAMSASMAATSTSVNTKSPPRGRIKTFTGIGGSSLFAASQALSVFEGGEKRIGFTLSLIMVWEREAKLVSGLMD